MLPRRCVLIAMAAVSLLAQEPPGTPPAAAPGVPAPPVLENTGKPIALPFACTVDDIQAAGLTCSQDDPCPVYLELAGVEGVGSRIFAAGNLHAQAVTLSSMLLASDDEGRTWREAHERIPSASLDRLQFFDAETGWASGEILSPLPQDPFLLLTTDGGKTWRRRPVFDENAEDHSGTILQFAFTARDSGSLIIDRGPGSDSDRYELYESPNGGESWTMRQTSAKPLRLPKADAAGTGDWRIRAERSTQAFDIERRRGGAWTPVASFLVKAGACRP